MFTFPQSVGIAGGRPSSSYYFVASQGNALFYLDPHLTRPAVPLETPPAPLTRRDPLTLTDQEDEPVIIERASIPYTLDVVDVDDSDYSDVSESPTKQIKKIPKPLRRLEVQTPPISPSPTGSPSTPSTPIARPSLSTKLVESSTSVTDDTPTTAVSPNTRWYINAYSESQLKTFHCEKVKKLPLSGLDPSMLLGFLCKDESEFEDLCERVSKVSIAGLPVG